MQVKNLEAFRRSLPAEAKMYVAKNTLLSLAADRVEGWSELKKGIKLENAWVFAPEEAISSSVKAFLDFEKKLLEPIPKADRSKFKLTDVTGAFSLHQVQSSERCSVKSQGQLSEPCSMLSQRFYGSRGELHPFTGHSPVSCGR